VPTDPLEPLARLVEREHRRARARRRATMRDRAALLLCGVAVGFAVGFLVAQDEQLRIPPRTDTVTTQTTVTVRHP